MFHDWNARCASAAHIRRAPPDGSILATPQPVIYRAAVNQPDLNLLPIFAAVAEARSMSGAGRRLEMPKSTVSRAISALEASLDIQLLHRTTRAVELTSAGRAFYDRVKPLVAGFQTLAGSLPEADDVPSGQLRITAPRDVAMTWLVRALAEFSRRYSAVEWHLIPTQREMDLVREGIDVALRISRKLVDSTLVARKLSPVDLGLYAAPSYLTRRGTPRTVADLAEHDWVHFAKVKVPPTIPRVGTIRASTDDLVFVCVAIKQGMGIGALPTFLGQDGVISGDLVRVIPSWTMQPASLYLVHPYRDHVPRKVSAFRDFFVSYLALHPIRAIT